MIEVVNDPPEINPVVQVVAMAIAKVQGGTWRERITDAKAAIAKYYVEKKK